MMAIEVPQRLRQARRLGLVHCEDRHWLAPSSVSNDLQCVMGQGTGKPQGRERESGECWARARDCPVLGLHGPASLEQRPALQPATPSQPITSRGHSAAPVPWLEVHFPTPPTPPSSSRILDLTRPSFRRLLPEASTHKRAEKSSCTSGPQVPNLGWRKICVTTVAARSFDHYLTLGLAIHAPLL